MEWVIGHCPDQYLWGYNRYKQPRRRGGAEAKA
jgi:lauroyl/myristoyl acyltransferase